jgi:hypothetical protein
MRFLHVVTFDSIISSNFQRNYVHCSMKTLGGENMIKEARGTKMKVFFQRLHIICVIFVLIYNLKICISDPFSTLHFRYKFILTTN